MPIEKNCWRCNKIQIFKTVAGYKASLKNNSVCTGCRNIVYPKMSRETIRKIRLASIKNLQIKKLNGEPLFPAFNRKACEYFDVLNNNNKWNLQHAMNGGEYHIKELGYWLDAFDKNTNIVVEWYEKHHFVGGKLKQKDIKRKDDIKQLVKCRFIGYNWNGIKIIDEEYIPT